MTQAQALNPLTLPLYGERLIEASAGTGKTFTLAVLYLRLLLGLGKENAYFRPLSVGEILVVTFTEAATEELRGRIRSNIHTLRLACVRGATNHPLFMALLDEIEDKSLAVNVLLAAERQIDEAAIYTIHGFCQRMLNNYAFESGVLFQQTLLQDESALQRQACADFWRRYCYPLPFAVASAVSKVCSGPEALLRDIHPYLQGEIPQLIPTIDENETLIQHHQKIIARIDEMKGKWRSVANDVAALIAASGVDKRSYNKANLPKWLSAVQTWADQATQDYAIPDALHRFGQQLLQEKTKKGDVPTHAVFGFIDVFCRDSLSLREVLLSHAVREVRCYIQQEKRRHAQLSFDDLLTRLAQALNQPNGADLAAAIRQRYPVAMIDEFQDTDPQQYHIFQRIYGKQSDTGLLLIGDPKQAIYAFRGADIFTYMHARSAIEQHYALVTNWRSSPGMVAAVNQLFNSHHAPFLFSQIPFLPVEAAKKNQHLGFVVNGQVKPAMALWLLASETGYSHGAYRQKMAACYATQICDWLTAGQRGEALLYDDNSHARPVTAQDITILVRNRTEAALMRDALGALHIPSVYLSNRDSVFATAEARDMLWLLQAMLTPEQGHTLRSALAAGLLGLSAAELDCIIQDETCWDALVDEFIHYRRQWLRYGVLPMLSELLAQRHIAENLLAMHGGERRLTDVLHLGELLQQAAQTLESEHALVRWLAQQIAHPAEHVESQQLRLESDRHLVQIVTIHKSKGLEFPIVCLPFIGAVRKPSFGLYHDRQNFQATWDLSLNEEAKTWAEEERLAEDLRLLYVALTRSIYHCSLGLAPLFTGKLRQNGATDVHRSAIGYLVQRGEAGDAALLRESLLALCGEHIALYDVSQTGASVWQGDKNALPLLSAKQFSRNMQDNWRVTSYSGLQQGSYVANNVFFDMLPHLDVEGSGARKQVLSVQRNPHTFPKGAMPGTFLHSILETLDFTQPISSAWLQEQLSQQGLDEVWLPVLQVWLADILHTPLSENGPCLAQIPPAARLVEMQFYLPIEQLLQSGELDALVKDYDPLSALCPKLDFQQVQGILKGFIDLVFCWQGRYYILDYKSNWLGDDESAYTSEAMMAAMVEHRYDLQYQIYSLALHRYLRHRVPNYTYQNYFGGVYYCFLRGMAAEKAGQGVFSCRPEEEMINAMDQLFLLHPPSSVQEGKG